MERPNAWKGYTKKDVKELNKLSREYREFLDEGKTERECVNKAVSMAEAAGYENLADIVAAAKKLKQGDTFFLWLGEEFHHLHHKYHFAPLGSRYSHQTPRYTSPQ